MTLLQSFSPRFKAGLALAFLLCGFAALAQYPNAPNKIGLGRQTTGDGLIYRTSGQPAWTPTTALNAWLAIDTTTGNMWTYRDGEWFLEVAGDLKVDYPKVINKSGVNILRGQVVMVDTSLLVQGDQVRILPAIATMSNSQFVMGVASEDIPNDSSSYVTFFGYVREVDHADIAQTGVTLDIGDILYISATEAGKYTDTEPAAPNVNATIALVVRKPNANNMTLLVRPWLNQKLGDLSDVDLAGLQTGDGIKWDGTKWVAGQFAGADSTLVSAGYGIDVSEVSNDFTVSADTSELSTKWFAADTASGVKDWVVAQNYLISGITAPNRLLLSDDTGTDTIALSTKLYYSNYPERLGVFQSSPLATLDVLGDVRISDLSTHTPIKLVGADADGDLGDLIIGNGLTVSGDSLIASGGAGTVTSIATNNGITGGTITTTGTIGLTGQALALHNLSTNGLIARTGAGTVSARTITAGTGISVTNGDGVSANPTITNSAPDQTVVLTAGTGINTSGTYPNFTITNSAPDQTVSIAAGTGISTSGSYPNFTITNSAPDQTVSIAGAGINAVTGTYPNFTITGTEVDGSVTNEGTLGVGAGGANTAVITSNTSGATGVTIAGGTNISVTESTSSNGGTVTIAATGLASSYIVQTNGETPTFGEGVVQNSTVNFTDTLNFVFFGLQAAQVYTENSTNKTSIVGEFSNLYNNDGSLTGARTISTNGNKLTISGSNAAQVLEIDNTNTGTSTNALTLQSFGPPLQATRLTSVSGSIVPVTDYYVNTSATAAAGLGGFQRFYIEDAGGLNKEAGRIGFRTSDAAGSTYSSEAFISVRKDSSELKEGFTLLSTGQLQFKEYGDTLFTGTPVKYLAVDDDGKVIEVDGAAGTVKGTGAANRIAIWASSDSLFQDSTFHWDEANGRLGIGTTSPSKTLDVNGDVQALINFTSSASQVLINFNGGSNTAFRGVRATTGWSDAVNAQWFQVGDANDNVVFSTKFGNASQRFAAITNSFHIVNSQNKNAPVGLFDVSNGNTKLFNILTSGNTGIGTTTPINKLDIEGGAAIGATYSGTNTAPTNGLLVEGETYIGKTTDNGAYNLQVSGAILTDSITISHSAQTAKISNFYPSGANGNNLFVGNNGGAALNSTSTFSSNNIGIGFNTLNKATSGYQNTMVGSGSGQELTTGLSNTATGFEALKNVSTGQQNTGVGDKALTSLTSGSYNTAVGVGANDGTTTASNNTSMGWFALTTIISGNDNTAVGYQAGRYSNSGSNLATNSNSTFVGSDARSGSTSATNEIVIGYQGRGNGSNTTTIGNTSTTRTHILGTLVASKGAPVTRTTSTYSMTNLPAVNYVIANFAGTMTITLPTASDWVGRELTIKTITANTVISDASNVVPIDDTTAGTAILPATDGAWAKLVSDGTNWIIMQKG